MAGHGRQCLGQLVGGAQVADRAEEAGHGVEATAEVEPAHVVLVHRHTGAELGPGDRGHVRAGLQALDGEDPAEGAPGDRRCRRRRPTGSMRPADGRVSGRRSRPTRRRSPCRCPGRWRRRARPTGRTRRHRRPGRSRCPAGFAPVRPLRRRGPSARRSTRRRPRPCGACALRYTSMNTGRSEIRITATIAYSMLSRKNSMLPRKWPRQVMPTAHTRRAEDVVGDEGAVAHLAHAGDDRGEGPHDRHEPGEEDRLRPVLLEEGVGLGDVRLLEEPRVLTGEQGRPDAAAEDVARPGRRRPQPRRAAAHTTGSGGRLPVTASRPCC